MAMHLVAHHAAEYEVDLDLRMPVCRVHDARLPARDHQRVGHTFDRALGGLPEAFRRCLTFQQLDLPIQQDESSKRISLETAHWGGQTKSPYGAGFRQA